ncbi:hypothetical protein DEW08_16495 [Azospirillum thermophilum]|uniref:DUF2336 domain-containing protein n=1 Tax=Azospirillum thermophilum TaxID=2202148 RepID=A0A2S2CU97_9PROT|nr:hypothetical protein DEW08_16495 [Azospirillum thermophilum]
MEYLFADPGGPAAPRRAAAGTAVARQVGDALVDSRLAGMGDADVRSTLARRLCRLLPGLPADGRDAVTAVTVRALEQLARDHVLRVREALASSIKDVACAPPSVVRQLARDAERTVAEPVLRCCAALTDEDLLAILADGPAGWALAAIARRPHVSAPVSDAIAGTGDAEATGLLLDNSGAVIAEPTLASLIEQAVRRPDWQASLARRPSLPPRLALRLAGFVELSVVELLRGRTDFDESTVAEIAAATRRRVDWVERRAPEETPERRAVRLHREGRLDETAIGDALSWNETGFLRMALALRCGVAPEVVDLVLGAHDAHAVTALVWKAGYSMRCAMQVQARAAGIAPRAMINARAGTGYPIDPDTMARHLARYGIGA